MNKQRAMACTKGNEILEDVKEKKMLEDFIDDSVMEERRAREPPLFLKTTIATASVNPLYVHYGHKRGHIRIPFLCVLWP